MREQGADLDENVLDVLVAATSTCAGPESIGHHAVAELLRRGFPDALLIPPEALERYRADPARPRVAGLVLASFASMAVIVVAAASVTVGVGGLQTVPWAVDLDAPDGFIILDGFPPAHAQRFECPQCMYPERDFAPWAQRMLHRAREQWGCRPCPSTPPAIPPLPCVTRSDPWLSSLVPVACHGEEKAP